MMVFRIAVGVDLCSFECLLCEVQRLADGVD